MNAEVFHTRVPPCLHCDGLNPGLIQHSGVCSGLRQSEILGLFTQGKTFSVSNVTGDLSGPGFAVLRKC